MKIAVLDLEPPYSHYFLLSNVKLLNNIETAKYKHFHQRAEAFASKLYEAKKSKSIIKQKKSNPFMVKSSRVREKKINERYKNNGTGCGCNEG